MKDIVKAMMLMAIMMVAALAVTSVVDGAGDTDATATNTPESNNNTSEASPVMIGDKGYTTLQDAMNDVPDGMETTIILRDNLTLTAKVEIPTDKNIILDMNGKEITADASISGRPITNHGTLVITGDGTFDSSADSKELSGPISNDGTIIIENGTFIGNIICNFSVIFNTTGGNMTINGGTFEGGTSALLAYTGSMTEINGGVFKSDVYQCVDNSGEMIITGGEFISSSCSSCNKDKYPSLTDPWGYAIRNGAYSDEAHLVIKPVDNTKLKVTAPQGCLTTVNGSMEVYGGTFETVDCERREGNAYYALYVNGEKGETSATVYGGIFIAHNRAAVQVGNSTEGDGGLQREANLTIFGGDFSVKHPESEYYMGVISIDRDTEESPSATVYGGNFSDNLPGGTLATGYTMDASGNIVLDTSAGNVKVVAVIGQTEFPSLSDALFHAADDETIILQADTTESITIPEGFTITIDLNGFTISNSESTQNSSIADADRKHTIINNGTLTIRDSSDSTGTVDNISHERAAVLNNGTFTLESGKLTRSQETYVAKDDPSNNSFYVFKNQGTAYITGGEIYGTSTYSSLIGNAIDSTDTDGASLTITGGTITQMDMNAVKNDEYNGILIITGGTINSNEQAVQNWNKITITGGTLNGDVGTWTYANMTNDVSTTIGGDAVVNGDVFSSKYASGENELDSVQEPETAITGGTINGTLATYWGEKGENATEDNWIQVSGGSFTKPVEKRFLTPGFVLTETDNGYGVEEGHRITFTVTPSEATATILITGPDGTEYQYGDGDLYLADGSYTYTYSAEGYISGNGAFTIDGLDVSEPISLIAEGTMVTVTLNYPDELGWPSEIIQIPYGGTLTYAQIPVEEGFVVDQDNTSMPVSITQNMSIEVSLQLVNPVISKITVSYDGGVAYIDVTATHPFDGAELIYILSPEVYGESNVLTVYESGRYTVYVGAIYGSIMSTGLAFENVEIEIPSDDTPVIVPPVDDDDYVPLPPHIVVDDDGDDDTVKVAACAAAAVAAAIIALILVAEYRKN